MAGSDPLSEEERALLETAALDGYFEVPRRTTLVDLADRHGMTDREASELLRSALDVVAHEAVSEKAE